MAPKPNKIYVYLSVRSRAVRAREIEEVPKFVFTAISPGFEEQPKDSNTDDKYYTIFFFFFSSSKAYLRF